MKIEKKNFSFFILFFIKSLDTDFGCLVRDEQN